MSRAPSQHRRIIERRKHPRIFTPPGALFSFKRLFQRVEIDEHTEGEGTLVDLSLGGCRLSSDVPLTIGERHHLILQVSKKSCPIIVETAVAQWIHEHTHGLKFTSMQPIHESHLRELLSELRRPAP